MNEVFQARSSLSVKILISKSQEKEVVENEGGFPGEIMTREGNIQTLGLEEVRSVKSRRKELLSVYYYKCVKHLWSWNSSPCR
jgi:hypothetical protein